jgi:hypothetical protein
VNFVKGLREWWGPVCVGKGGGMVVCGGLQWVLSLGGSAITYSRLLALAQPSLIVWKDVDDSI